MKVNFVCGSRCNVMVKSVVTEINRQYSIGWRFKVHRQLLPALSLSNPVFPHMRVRLTVEYMD